MIDNEGHILTNAHVVDGASDVTVTVGGSDGQTYPAKVVGDRPLDRRRRALGRQRFGRS